MTDPSHVPAAGPPPPAAPPQPENDHLLVKGGGIVTLVCTGIVYAVNNFEKIKPVIEHPAMLFVVLTVWTLGAFGIGGGAVYTLIFQPMERRLSRSESELGQRLAKAEGLVSELRKQEREMIRTDGERLASITGLERDVTHLTETVAELRQALQRIQSEQSLDRRARQAADPEEPA